MENTNLPTLGQSQLFGLRPRSNLDKDVFCLEPNRTWRQNSLGRVAPRESMSVNSSSILFCSSVFSISFSTSMSIVCRITHQHSPACNGMGRNTNCNCHTLHTASGCHPHRYCMSQQLWVRSQKNASNLFVRMVIRRGTQTVLKSVQSCFLHTTVVKLTSATWLTRVYSSSACISCGYMRPFFANTDITWSVCVCNPYLSSIHTHTHAHMRKKVKMVVAMVK